jgi:nitrogen regulatory protein PII
VIIEDDRVERVVAEITEQASTGLQGDGLLSVFRLDTVVHLRSKRP